MSRNRVISLVVGVLGIPLVFLLVFLLVFHALPFEGIGDFFLFLGAHALAFVAGGCLGYALRKD